MHLSDFDFDLPDSHIALRPAQPRDHARLLKVVTTFSDHHVYDLPKLLRPGDMLVFNDTRVIPARLFGRRGEVKVEVLLHKAIDHDVWEVYAKPAKRLKPSQQIVFSEALQATVESKDEAAGTINLRFSVGGADLMRVLEDIGSTPLPPYIARHADTNDRHDYQTIFARDAGSVAAPTASLHYTPELMQNLQVAGIDWCTITLHVGAGTFMPVRTENVDDHIMHAERCVITADTAAKINAVRAAGGRIIPVGTTAMRTLESAATDDGVLHAMNGETRIFIKPGYKFKASDALLTNFHLPKSTLLMLVSAFCGMERTKAFYQHAIDSGYRFYSYGDTCLLYPAK